MPNSCWPICAMGVPVGPGSCPLFPDIWVGITGLRPGHKEILGVAPVIFHGALGPRFSTIVFAHRDRSATGPRPGCNKPFRQRARVSSGWRHSPHLGAWHISYLFPFFAAHPDLIELMLMPLVPKVVPSDQISDGPSVRYLSHAGGSPVHCFQIKAIFSFMGKTVDRTLRYRAWVRPLVSSFIRHLVVGMVPETLSI